MERVRIERSRISFRRSLMSEARASCVAPSEIHSTRVMTWLYNTSPTMRQLRKTLRDDTCASSPQTVDRLLIAPLNSVVSQYRPKHEASIPRISRLTSCLVVWNLKSRQQHLFVMRAGEWFPDMFYKRTTFTSLGKNPKEPHSGGGKGFFAGVAIWPPRTEQQIKLSAV